MNPDNTDVMKSFSSSPFNVFLLVLCSLFCSCKGPVLRTEQSEIPSDSVFAAKDLKRTPAMDSLECDSILNAQPALASFHQNVRLFYAARQWSPAWYGEDTWREHIGLLMQLIEGASSEGIRDSFPALVELQDRLNRFASVGEFDPGLEVLLTSAFFWYAEKSWRGLPEKTSRALDWFLPRVHRDAGAWLDSALTQQPDAGVLSKALFVQYYSLLSMIQEYDTIRKLGGWPRLELTEMGLTFGDTGQDVLALKKSLLDHGDLQESSNEPVFDSVLTKALMRFQRRHGLKPDGICGKSVVKELNVPVEDRIAQMLVNLERCRWMPNAFPERFLLVNIPEFTLHVVDNKKPVDRMPVVVGKEMHQTVSFIGTMNTVVFHPYWVIPSGILYNEIIPSVLRNTLYLQRNNMEVVGASGKLISPASINWKSYRKSGFPYTIRQRPGPENPLGEIKFLFPNNHSIYLHDTPGKSLFVKEKRTFSHGCIRLGDAKRLADFVLKAEGWSSQAIDSAFGAKKERWVNLKQDLPVFIVYFTSWVDEDGVLQFRDDIYGRDERLKHELLD